MQQVTICLAAEKMVAEKANYPIIENKVRMGKIEISGNKLRGKERKNNQFVALSAAERNNNKMESKSPKLLDFLWARILVSIGPVLR